MTHPTLFRWIKRWFWGGVIVIGTFALGLAVVNVSEALPFWLAVRRIHRLSPREWEDLAAVCSRTEQGGHQRGSGKDIPAALQALKPIEVSIYTGSSDIRLYKEIDLIYVFVRISTSPESQIAQCVAYGPNGQHNHTLWRHDSATKAPTDPVDRIVTITERTMHEARHWIVRPQEIIAIESEAHGVVARWPLSATARAEIEAALYGIDGDVRGHAFDIGAYDGSNLQVTFTPDGSESADDIVLLNTWRPELAPLVEVISRVTDKEHAITFPERIARWHEQDPEPPPAQVMTLAAYHRRQNRIPLPWWRLWPRLDVAGWCAP